MSLFRGLRLLKSENITKLRRCSGHLLHEKYSTLVSFSQATKIISCNLPNAGVLKVERIKEEVDVKWLLNES